MPIYMDRHYLAHNTDLAVQDQYRVRFLTYWFYEVRSTAFCLVDSPDKGNHQASPPGVARPAPRTVPDAVAYRCKRHSPNTTARRQATAQFPDRTARRRTIWESSN
jgi:hypothetical protein